MSLKGKFCIISIGENTLSVEYSDIYHVLSNRFLKPGSCCWLNFCPSKSEKLNRATNFFHWIYGYEIVVTDYHFNNQKGVD